MLPHQEAKWWMNQDMSKFPGPILLHKNGERRKKTNAEQISSEGEWNQAVVEGWEWDKEWKQAVPWMCRLEICTNMWDVEWEEKPSKWWCCQTCGHWEVHLLATACNEIANETNSTYLCALLLMGDTQKLSPLAIMASQSCHLSVLFLLCSAPRHKHDWFSISQVPKKTQASQSNNLVYYMAEVH